MLTVDRLSSIKKRTFSNDCCFDGCLDFCVTLAVQTVVFYRRQLYVTVPCRNILLHVSIAFATFKALTAKLLLRVGGGWAHMCFIDAWITTKFTKHVWASPLTDIQRYGTLKTAMRPKYTAEWCSCDSSWSCLGTEECIYCRFKKFTLLNTGARYNKYFKWMTTHTNNYM